MHSIVERKANSDDFHSAEDIGRLKAPELGCAIVGFGILPMAFFGIAGRNAFGFAGLVGGVVLGAAIFTLLMIVSWKQRTQQRKFVTQGDVQEITIDTAECFSIDLYNSDPILVFDIGLDKLLVLQGQWLFEADTYGYVENTEDPVEEYFNGLPGPYYFPSSSFSIVRKANNGDVISIRPTGAYLVPKSLEDTLYANKLPPQSQLVPGSSENLIGDILTGTDFHKDA